VMRWSQALIRESRRIRYVILSPRTCLKEAPTCDQSSRVWAMPISRRRKSILMSMVPGSKQSTGNFIQESGEGDREMENWSDGMEYTPSLQYSMCLYRLVFWQSLPYSY